MLPWPIAEEKLPMFPVLAMSPESVEFEPPNKDEAKPDINSPVRLSRKRRLSVLDYSVSSLKARENYVAGVCAVRRPAVKVCDPLAPPVVSLAVVMVTLSPVVEAAML
jgi:hypothetical protein